MCILRNGIRRFLNRKSSLSYYLQLTTDSHCNPAEQHAPTVMATFYPILKNGYTNSTIMYKNGGLIRWYSERFKLKILSELSTGNYNKRDFGGIYGLDMQKTPNKK